jgi:hypothetical protein
MGWETASSAILTFSATIRENYRARTTFILSCNLHRWMRADGNTDYFSSIGGIFVVGTVPMVTEYISGKPQTDDAQLVSAEAARRLSYFFTEQRLA